MSHTKETGTNAAQQPFPLQVSLSAESMNSWKRIYLAKESTEGYFQTIKLFILIDIRPSCNHTQSGRVLFFVQCGPFVQPVKLHNVAMEHAGTNEKNNKCCYQPRPKSMVSS